MRTVLAWSLAACVAASAAVLAVRAPALDHRPPTESPADGDDRLARCRGLGEAAGRDAQCQAAWRQARERFFGRTAP